MRNQLCADVALLCRILLIKCATVLLQVSTDLSLLLPRQQCTWARSPYELFEPVQDMFLEFLPAEIPDSIPVLKLISNQQPSVLVHRKSYRMPPCTRTCRQVPPTRIPLYICNSVVICGAELLNASAPLRRLAFPAFFAAKIEVPELKLRFGG